MTTNIEQTKENTLTIERVFNAPRELVWKAWSEKEHYEAWMGPKGWTMEVKQLEFRVGGKYLNCMSGRMPDGSEAAIWSTGIYTEIVPLEKIVATDSFADENGKQVHASHYGMPKELQLEFIVEVNFSEVNGKTKMVMHHIGMSGEMQKGADQGWNSSFDKLEELLVKI